VSDVLSPNVKSSINLTRFITNPENPSPVENPTKYLYGKLEVTVFKTQSKIALPNPFNKAMLFT
jgi:hypothetical protein